MEPDPKPINMVYGELAVVRAWADRKPRQNTPQLLQELTIQRQRQNI